MLQFLEQKAETKQRTNLPSIGIVIQRQGRHQHDGKWSKKTKIKRNYHTVKCIGTNQTDGLQATPSILPHKTLKNM